MRVHDEEVRSWLCAAPATSAELKLNTGVEILQSSELKSGGKHSGMCSRVRPSIWMEPAGADTRRRRAGLGRNEHLIIISSSWRGVDRDRGGAREVGRAPAVVRFRGYRGGACGGPRGEARGEARGEPSQGEPRGGRREEQCRLTS